MSKVTDFLVNMLAVPIEKLGEAELDIVLEDQHTRNPADYRAAIIGSHAGIQHLKVFTDKSNSNLLKGLVSALDEEITFSAAKNGITF